MKRWISAVAIGASSLAVLSGCSGSTTVNPSPSPVKTVAITKAPVAPAPTVIPDVVQGKAVKWNDSEVQNAVKDTPYAQVALAAVDGFARAQLSPIFLSGKYEDDSIAKVYQPIVGDALLTSLRGVSPANLEDSYLAMSLGAFLDSSSSVKTATYCTPQSTDLSDCLGDDVTLSDVKVYPVVDGTNQVQVSFKVSTVRLVISDAKAAASTIDFQDSIWVDITTGKIESVDCSFSFGKVTSK
jgi:hypothetical protein